MADPTNAAAGRSLRRVADPVLGERAAVVDVALMDAIAGRGWCEPRRGTRHARWPHPEGTVRHLWPVSEAQWRTVAHGGARWRTVAHLASGARGRHRDSEEGEREEKNVMAVRNLVLERGEPEAIISALREANQRLVIAGLREQALAELAETALAGARRAEAARAAARCALARRAAETAALRELGRLKDEFLGTVSHELRGALQVVAAPASCCGSGSRHRAPTRTW